MVCQEWSGQVRSGRILRCGRGRGRGSGRSLAGEIEDLQEWNGMAWHGMERHGERGREQPLTV